jgi:hypothetical protein
MGTLIASSKLLIETGSDSYPSHRLYLRLSILIAYLIHANKANDANPDVDCSPTQLPDKLFGTQ